MPRSGVGGRQVFFCFLFFLYIKSQSEPRQATFFQENRSELRVNGSRRGTSPNRTTSKKMTLFTYKSTKKEKKRKIQTRLFIHSRAWATGLAPVDKILPNPVKSALCQQARLIYGVSFPRQRTFFFLPRSCSERAVEKRLFGVTDVPPLFILLACLRALIMMKTQND